MKHRRSGSGFPGSARLIGRNFRNEKNAVLIDLIHVKEVGGSAYSNKITLSKEKKKKSKSKKAKVKFAVCRMACFYISVNKYKRSKKA